MTIVNIVWIGFLLFLIILGILSSIFNKSIDIDVDIVSEMGNKSKSKPKIKYKRRSKSKIKVELVNPKSKVELVKSKSIKPKEPKSKPISQKPNINPKSKSKVEKVKPHIKIEDENIKKSIKSTNINSKNGFIFNGCCDNDEVDIVVKFASRNGYMIQTDKSGRVILTRWIKTKPSYDRIVKFIDNNKSDNGIYSTYLIWKSLVTKYKLDIKMQ